MPADTTPPSRRTPAPRDDAPCEISATANIPISESIPWDEVRSAYTDSREPIAALCNRFDITPGELRNRRLAEGWPARPSPIQPRRSALPAVPNPAPPAKKPTAPAIADPPADPATILSPRKRRADRISRFYATIDGDLAKLEALLKPADLSPGDAERLIRSLASIIHSYERVLELDPAARHIRPGTSPNTGNSKSQRTASANASNPHASDPAGPADAERLRTEIADRIERLMDKGIAARNPDEPAP